MPSDAVLTSKCLAAWPRQKPMRAELAKVCTHAHVRCAHAHDMLRRNSRVVDASACRAVRLHSHKSFAHLESRDKLSDVIESSSSITCSCAVSIRGTPGAAPRQSRGNFWEWVAGPTSARQQTSLTPELAQTNFLVCADGHDLLPGVAHLLKGATASRHGKTGPGREGGSRIRL